MGMALLVTGYYRHPKLLHANSVSGGELAETLWVRGLDYVNEHRTDGQVPAGIPAMLTPSKTAARIKGLVTAGLWIPDGDAGWRYHDYLEWNRSAEQLEARAAAISRKRSEAGKAGAQVRWNGRLAAVRDGTGEGRS